MSFLCCKFSFPTFLPAAFLPRRLLQSPGMVPADVTAYAVVKPLQQYFCLKQQNNPSSNGHSTSVTRPDSPLLKRFTIINYMKLGCCTIYTIAYPGKKSRTIRRSCGLHAFFSTIPAGFFFILLFFRLPSCFFFRFVFSIPAVRRLHRALSHSRVFPTAP